MNVSSDAPPHSRPCHTPLENDLGAEAFFQEGEEVPVIEAADAKEAAAAVGFDIREAKKKLVEPGRLPVRLLLKTWRDKDDALALYFKPVGWLQHELEKERLGVWRVLVYPNRRHHYPLGPGGPDLRRLRLGTRLKITLEDSKGWPNLVGGRIEKGELLDRSAMKARPQPSSDRSEKPEATRPAAEEGREKKHQLDAPGGRSEPRQTEPDFIRKGLWTYRQDGVVAGVLLATGKRVSDSVLASAAREIQAYSLTGDHSIEEIADALDVSKGTVRSYLERAGRLTEQGYSPGARPEKGLSAADVRAYMAIKRGISTPANEEAGIDGRLLFLIERVEDGRTVKEGPYQAGDPRLEDARHWEDTRAILKGTGLTCREGNPLFEHDLVRAHESMDTYQITWNREHLRWQAGESFSLAQLDALARNHFGEKGLERIE